MYSQSSFRKLSLVVAAAATGLCLAPGKNAGAQTSRPDVTVTIFAEHYAVSGRAIDDLDVLEATVSAIRPQSIRLNACGAGTDRARQAAAHRFRNVHLELRILETDSTDCQAKATVRPVSQRFGQRPFGIVDAAIESWWNELTP